MTTDNHARLEALARERLNAVYQRDDPDDMGEVRTATKPCVVIERLEQRIAALEERVATLDGALDGGDNQSDYWDGTPPLGGDSFDGR